MTTVPVARSVTTAPFGKATVDGGDGRHQRADGEHDRADDPSDDGSASGVRTEVSAESLEVEDGFDVQSLSRLFLVLIRLLGASDRVVTKPLTLITVSTSTVFAKRCPWLDLCTPLDVDVRHTLTHVSRGFRGPDAQGVTLGE